MVCLPGSTACQRPNTLTATNIGATTALLGWTQSTTDITQWEVIVLPHGSPHPQPSDSGTLTSANPYLATGLTGGTMYTYYVRAICPSGGTSNWTQGLDFNTLPANDECANAVDVSVNLFNGCAQIAHGSLHGATASTPALPASCSGTADDDVWFKFVATNSYLNVTLRNPYPASNDLRLSVYMGNCGSLILMNCSTYSSMPVTGLVVGQTYYVRVYSLAATPVTTEFDLCITTPSTCATASPVCGVQNYPNTTGIASLGQIGCLFSSPNPTFFTVKITNSGSVKLLLTQSEFGSTTPNLDVDYAAWGPFTSPGTMCSGISAPTFSCSYSSAAAETFNIPNAVAGEYYILLITNFSNDPGYINVTVDPTSTGSIDCSGIRLEAFLDANGNNIKDAGEVNFTLGQFNYEANNDGNVHQAQSSTGIYTIYDAAISNTYDLGYSVLPEYASVYNASTAYSNAAISTTQMSVYEFPVTSTQSFSDLSVALTPSNAPRAGNGYQNTIVYTNNGNQPIASGTITFNHDPATSISNISQAGTSAIANGFTYVFSNLQPFESRSITINLSVPAIPAVSIGQLLTNTVSGAIVGTDFLPSNNSSNSTQAIIAAYDPNDKTEAHGGKIAFSSFGANDYLYYTVRFENVGNTSATNIKITDLLDSQIDENSFVMVNATHDYTLDRVGRNLIWHFNGINLPVSVANSQTGKGSLTFKVKLKPGFAIGDIVPNSAEIYFDANPSVITNTFLTEFVSSLANQTFDAGSVSIYPNPANTVINISLQNPAGTISKICVYDIVGKSVKKAADISASEFTVDVSDLSKGMYLIEIETASGSRIVKKLIKE